VGLSKIGNSLLRYCNVLTKGCACCCDPVIDPEEPGNAPTISVFGQTFTLNVFPTFEPATPSFWSSDPAVLVSGNVVLYTPKLYRLYYTGCDVTCAVRYLMRSKFLSTNINAVKYDNAGNAIGASYLETVLGRPLFYDWSPWFRKIGGNSWTKEGLETEFGSLPSGAFFETDIGNTIWRFTD
jgi:hypothetical protein